MLVSEHNKNEQKINKQKGLITIIIYLFLLCCCYYYYYLFAGPPDNITINVFPAIINDSIVFSFNITDNSNAPATNISISLLGTNITTQILFNDLGIHIPVHQYFNNTFELNRTDIVAGDYNVMINAGNYLGNQTVFTESVFLNGE